MAVMTHDKELDARGLNCPLPILRARKALNELASGQVLRVVATDPGSTKDFEAFCRQTGNELLSQAAGEKEFVFYMRKK
jgi:tRNA 2-thiouridine synthesizing protein A